MSGRGMSVGNGNWCEGCRNSGFWNEHIIVKIVFPSCDALTVRVV